MNKDEAEIRELLDKLTRAIRDKDAARVQLNCSLLTLWRLISTHHCGTAPRSPMIEHGSSSGSPLGKARSNLSLAT
jgi:hypothetical protein